MGEQIRDARIAKGYSQTQLSAKINVSINTLSGLESGRRKSTSIIILQLISDELGIKFAIGHEPEPNI